MPKLFLTDEKFREEVRGGNTPDAVLRKSFIGEVKAEGDESRSVDFILSTDSVDRSGDVISVKGWDISNYRKNPVVLWAHDASQMPVGRAANVRIEDGKLKATVEFMGADINPFAEAVMRAVKGGFLSACSVGFAPRKYAFSEEDGRTWGIDYLEQELLEWSIVPVPCNQDALVEMRSAAMAMTPGSPLRSWVDEALEKAGLVTLPSKQFASIMALPTRLRETADRLPERAKGARGQILRCAGVVERQIMAEAETEVEVVDDDGEPLQAAPVPETTEEIETLVEAAPPSDVPAPAPVEPPAEMSDEAKAKMAAAARKLALLKLAI